VEPLSETAVGLYRSASLRATAAPPASGRLPSSERGGEADALGGGGQRGNAHALRHGRRMAEAAEAAEEAGDGGTRCTRPSRADSQRGVVFADERQMGTWRFRGAVLLHLLPRVLIRTFAICCLSKPACPQLEAGGGATASPKRRDPRPRGFHVREGITKHRHTYTERRDVRQGSGGLPGRGGNIGNSQLRAASGPNQSRGVQILN
jgi:hypothetical protein